MSWAEDIQSVSTRHLLEEREIKVEFAKLKNGIRLLIINDPNAKVISFINFVSAGGIDLLDGKHGLAHLFEHLMFKGSKNYPGREFLDFLDARGSAVNAMTQRDQTIFYETFAKAHLDEVLKREVDRLLNLSLTQEQLTIEKKVVLSERLMRIHQDPRGEFLEHYFNKIYRGTIYAGSVIGTEDEIISYSVDECKTFYKTHYRPNQFVMGFYGSVDAEKLKQSLEKELKANAENSDLSLRNDGQPKKILSSFQVPPTRYVEKGKTNSPHLIISYPIPAITSEDKERIDALNWYLFQKGDSYMVNMLVEKSKVANGISSQLEFGKYDSYWHISLEGKQKISLKKLLSVFDHFLLNARKRLENEHDWHLISQWSKYSLFNEIDEPFSLLSKMMFGIFYFNDPWRMDHSFLMFEKMSNQKNSVKFLEVFDRYLQSSARSIGGFTNKPESI